jgi:hypothetical protein
MARARELGHAVDWLPEAGGATRAAALLAALA